MRDGLTKDELVQTGKQRVFQGECLRTISFPLGGVGTGSVGLNGTGGLQDWEIFNRPGVGTVFPRTFPLIWAREDGQEPVCRVLRGTPPPPYLGSGGGDPCANGEGFPHMESNTFRGEYPFAYVDFKSKAVPVSVSLEAYNPFIPSAPDDSGFPAAVLRYRVKNRKKTPVECTVAWSLWNPIGTVGGAEHAPNAGDIEHGPGQNVNAIVSEDGLQGVCMTTKKWKKSHPRYGSMTLVSPDEDVTALDQWLRAPAFAPVHDFWDRFSAAGTFEPHGYGPSDEGQSDAGAVGVKLKLAPGESKTATFYITWHFPNFEKYWGPEEQRTTWKNYYARQFRDALDVAKQLQERENDLYQRTQAFHKALFSSTVPPHVLEAVSSQMAILKTATVIRLEDGTFYGFEGCSPHSGCCEGSCTHVWNYQQALPFLFPSLERSMRTADYENNLRDDGGMCFRIQLPLGQMPNEFHAAADGQMGGIIKTYRDWKISGDDAWLKSVWPKAKQALEFAWKQWDPDRQGVMTGVQHNTYDIEFYGANPLTACFYLTALEAGARIAEHLGDAASAGAYREIIERGRAYMDERLWNGGYYAQEYDFEEGRDYQFGAGCLSDQVLGVWMGEVAGIEPALPKDRLQKTLASIYKHNWMESLAGHANAQRVYARDGEPGLILCSWPNGGRPKVPFLYSDEVWTGIEYQAASHLIMHGHVTEGLRIAKAVRMRHDGAKRNPWNEYECGNHYARAMSSYGLLTALAGFTYDKGAGRLGFKPAMNTEDFTCFWALDGAWGTYTQKRNKKRTVVRLHVLEGELKVRELDVAAEFTKTDGRIYLEESVRVTPDNPLKLSL
jgi:uncharacterized protein (DUF608 family)